MTRDRLRGRRRDEFAHQLALQCHAERSTVTITDLADRFGRKPSAVRQLLTEAGVRSRRLLIGLADDEITEELARRFKHGAPVQELRQLAGIDERAIRDRLRQAGVELAKRRRRGDLTVPIPKLVELYEAGAKLDDLTALSGGSYGTVRRVLIANGVQLRARGGR